MNVQPQWVAFSLTMIVVLAAAAEGQERAGLRLLDTPDETSLTASRRFEGYRYLDLEGQPLPFQSDEEIEAFLANAEIIETSSLGTGITLPRRVVLQGDGFRARAIFKDVDVTRQRVTERINGRNHFSLDWRDWHGYDVAAYILDRLLGLDRVPPAVPRQIGSDQGTIRIWLETTVSEFERASELHISPPNPQRWNQQRLMMQVFDNLVANRDSNLGNLLIDPNWRAWFIDCTRCFGTTETLYYPLKHISRCERGLWEGLRNLDPDTVREQLEPYLGRVEIKALLARHQKMVRHFQILIDELGETRVLFDVEPATAVAPWGTEQLGLAGPHNCGDTRQPGGSAFSARSR